MSTNNFPGVVYAIGQSFNFFQKVSVTATTFGGTTSNGQQPDMIILFPTQGCLFLNEGVGVLEISLNGTDVHFEMDSTKSTAGFAFDGRIITKIWARVQAGSTGPIIFSVQAWGQS